MRPIPLQLSASEALALTDVLAVGLQLLQPVDIPSKLNYLLLSRLYTRLFTKRPFLRATQRIALRPEEACALVMLLESGLPGSFWDSDTHATVVARRVYAELHQRLS